jgi:HSP20 family molecular chaperone IbpA
MAIIKVEDAGSPPDIAERLTKEFDDLADRIRRRAYELFEDRGGEHGADLNDWFLAEEEIFFPAKLDVTREPGSYRLSLSVPGFQAKDFRVYTLGNQLVLQGATQERLETGAESASTTRSVLYRWPLPSDAIPDEISAEGKKNSLEITVPVSSEPVSVQAEPVHEDSAEQTKSTAA